MAENTDKLRDVSETMLITVWARAVETERNGGLIQDPAAAEMLKHIDYDFSAFDKATMSQVGCCIRANVMDRQAQTFLDQYPDAVVVQLGAGLDTRYHRLSCPDITHWYDLDLPEAIDIRRQLCPTHPNNTLLSMSMLEEAWIDTVLAHNKPVLIICEGVLMYCDETEVRAFFDMLCQRFERTTVLFDMLAYMAKGRSKHHDAVKRTKQKAEFKWSLLNSKDMEQWNDRLHITEEHYMSDCNSKRFPLLLRLLYKTPWGYRQLNQRMLRVDINDEGL